MYINVEATPLLSVTGENWTRSSDIASERWWRGNFLFPFFSRLQKKKKTFFSLNGLDIYFINLKGLLEKEGERFSELEKEAITKN